VKEYVLHIKIQYFKLNGLFSANNAASGDANMSRFLRIRKNLYSEVKCTLLRYLVADHCKTSPFSISFKYDL